MKAAERYPALPVTGIELSCMRSSSYSKGNIRPPNGMSGSFNAGGEWKEVGDAIYPGVGW